MALEKFELVHKNEKWHFKKTGKADPLKSFATKAAGLAHVMKAGKKHGNCSVKIKKVDGTIQEERTYGADPRRSKG